VAQSAHLRILAFFTISTHCADMGLVLVTVAEQCPLSGGKANIGWRACLLLTLTSIVWSVKPRLGWQHRKPLTTTSPSKRAVVP
jgi:hypothetical protein